MGHSSTAAPPNTQHTSPLLSPQSRFLIPSIILHFCLPASFFPHDSLWTHVLPVVLPLWENFTSDRNTAPSSLSYFRFPSLPPVLSGTGGRMWPCKGGVGSALFNISHPPVVKCYAFRKVQGRVSELRLGGENIWRTVLKVNVKSEKEIMHHVCERFCSSLLS